MTSSLFATTVLASFFVVALPHILPCPAPRVAYADSSSGAPPNTAYEVVVLTNPDGTTTTKRRRLRPRPRQSPEVRDGIAAFVGGAETEGEARTDADADVDAVGGGMGSAGRPRGSGRECPVPKPGGIIGELMGFKKSGGGGGVADAEDGGGDPTTTTKVTTTTTTSGSTIRPRIMTRPRTEEKGDGDGGGGSGS